MLIVLLTFLALQSWPTQLISKLPDHEYSRIEYWNIDLLRQNDDGLKEVALYQFGEDVDISSTRFFSQYEDFAGSIRQKDKFMIVETPAHGGQ